MQDSIAPEDAVADCLADPEYWEHVVKMGDWNEKYDRSVQD